MPKKTLEKSKVIVKQLAIAFFFTSFFIFLSLTITKNKIDKSIRFINNFAVLQNYSGNKNKNIKIDTVTRRLVEYPSYGDVWGKIRIPKSSIEANIYHGDTLNLLKYGVGHHAGSYFPGEGGTILLAGHNSSRDLGRLPEAKIGDEVIIEAIYGNYTYKIDSFEVLEAKELNERLRITDQKETLIVYTCYPVDTPGYKSKRYIIYASLVGDTNE